MFDVGDLPVLDNCVLKSDLSDYKWPLKLYLLNYVFSKSKNMTFYVFFELLKKEPT